VNWTRIYRIATENTTHCPTYPFERSDFQIFNSSDFHIVKS
jgi:hypothetical protein